MHLKKQVASRLGHVANGWREFKGWCARHPTTKEELGHIHAIVPETLVPWVGVCRVQSLRLGDDRGVVGVANEGVMVDGGVPRAHFDRRNFRGLRESCGNDEHLILIRHVAFMQERLRHAQHKVGLPDLAALRKVGQTRVVGRIPFRHALIDPVAD